MGLVDSEYDLSREDVKRVMLLGDSFTFWHACCLRDRGELADPSRAAPKTQAAGRGLSTAMRIGP